MKGNCGLVRSAKNGQRESQGLKIDKGSRPSTQQKGRVSHQNCSTGKKGMASNKIKGSGLKHNQKEVKVDMYNFDSFD